MPIAIAELMETSGVKFGTSGARGLADAITDKVAYSYTTAFLNHLKENGLSPTSAVAIAGDLRPSSPRIMAAIGQAVEDLGMTVINGGFIASPAIALYGLNNNCPAIMVTGSHIPDDRNGIKFNRTDGEIDKSDEIGIKAQNVFLSEASFNANGSFIVPHSLPEANPQIEEAYTQRWVDFFGSQSLQGKRIGVYQHSTVGRDNLVEIFSKLGATVTALGRSETFIPVDTEAIRPEDAVLARDWCAQGAFDALVSADGDCDRPLLSTETGEWVRGDVLGVLCAQYLKADGIATPVSCNTALEKSQSFEKIARTRIGSPFVIAAMAELADAGCQKIVGYEANGGFLQWSPISIDGKTLPPLPTRDPVIACVGALLLAQEKNCSLSQLLETLPQRYTASDRLQEFPTELSQAKLGTFNTGDLSKDLAAFSQAFAVLSQEATEMDSTDGLRFTLENLEVVHLRPSGNAPELRCYTEASSPERALSLNQTCLEIMKGWRS